MGACISIQKEERTCVAGFPGLRQAFGLRIIGVVIGDRCEGCRGEHGAYMSQWKRCKAGL